MGKPKGKKQNKTSNWYCLIAPLPHWFFAYCPITSLVIRPLPHYPIARHESPLPHCPIALLSHWFFAHCPIGPHRLAHFNISPYSF